jgi:hypothetical protein
VRGWVALKRLGLPWYALQDASSMDADAPAIDRMVARIEGLSDDPEVHAAARRGRERMREIEGELETVRANLDAEPGLEAQLVGVRDHLELENTRTRALLAELYGGLRVRSSQTYGEDEAVRDSLDALAAEREVRSLSARARRAATTA